MSPRISRFQDWIPMPDGEHKKVFTVVNYSSKEGRFIIELPEHMSEVLDYGRITAASQGEVEHLWDREKKKYKDLKESESRRKVIAIDFKATALIKRGGEQVFFRDDISFASSPTVEFSFIEGYEIKRGKQGNHDSGILYDLDMNPTGLYYRDVEKMVLVDWTQERVDFLQQIKTAMENLILKLDEFTDSVKKDNKFLEEKIKEGRLLPEQAGE